MNQKLKNKKIECTWVTAMLVAVGVIAASAVISIEYGALLGKIDWSLVTLAFLLCFGAYMLYRWNAGAGNDYNVMDIVTTDGKADLYKHLIIFFGGLSAWVIIKTTLGNKPVETMLLGVLGIFVGKVAIDGIAKAWQAKGTPDTQVSVNTNVSSAPNQNPETKQ